MITPVIALERIWKLVHTPTSKTRYSGASQHFQADFDEIRKIVGEALASASSQSRGAQ